MHFNIQMFTDKHTLIVNLPKLPYYRSFDILTIINFFWSKHFEPSHLQQFVVSWSSHEESAIIKLHLSVLQEIVENRQNIALCLLDTFKNKNPPRGSSLNSTLQSK